jgi:hypothetical protein
VVVNRSDHPPHLGPVGSNLTLKDKTLCIEAIKPFVILGKSLMGVAREESRLEPENIGSTERQKEPCGSLSPRGLGSDAANQFASGHQCIKAGKSPWRFQFKVTAGLFGRVVAGQTFPMLKQDIKKSAHSTARE